MAKVSVEQALAKAKSHIKKGELAEAQALYVTILKAFPNNKKAQQGLTLWVVVNDLLLNRARLRQLLISSWASISKANSKLVVSQTHELTAQYP